MQLNSKFTVLILQFVQMSHAFKTRMYWYSSRTVVRGFDHLKKFLFHTHDI